MLKDCSLTRSDRDALDELDRFLREDWESSGWEQRLRDRAEAYGQRLFKTSQLKEYYRECAKLGHRLPVAVEHRVPNDHRGENCRISAPSEFWMWGRELAILAHPVFKRIRFEYPLTSYSEPILFPEIPDLILLIAGEPKGYGNPSADDMVDGIADIWERSSHKLAEKHGRYPEIIKLHFEHATKSKIEGAVERPLAQLDQMDLQSSQSGHLFGLIHWVGRSNVEQGQLRSLWVRGRDQHELQELSPRRLVSFLDRARERRIHWQFLFICSYREKDDWEPIPTPGCSQVIEPLVLRAGVPSVLGLLRPVWRECADNLATEFYRELLASYYDHRLPERDIPKAVFQIRKELYQDFKDGVEPCYYSWAAPLLVMQQTEETTVAPKPSGLSAAPVRTEDLQYIVSCIRDGRCCSLVGPSHMGKSLLLESLSEGEALEACVPEGVSPPVTIFVNCLELAARSEQAFYELLLRCILNELRGSALSRSTIDALRNLHREILDATTPLAAWARLADGMRQLSRELENQLVLLLDKFGYAFRTLPAASFRGLRALHDAPETNLRYVVATSRRLERLRSDEETRPFRELFDLCTLVLRPLSEEDCRRFVAHLDEGRDASLRSDHVSRVIELSGGHPGLLERVYHILIKPEVPFQLTPTELINKQPIQKLCQDLWSELEEGDREGLLALVEGDEVALGAERRRGIEAKGLVVEEEEGKPAIFSPVFEIFVRQKLSEERQPARAGLRYDAETGQIWLNGRDIRPKLSPNQYKLLVFMCQHAGMVCTKDEIAEAVWPKRIKDREGITDAQIQALVGRLREKIGSDLIVTVRGQGYRLRRPQTEPR